MTSSKTVKKKHYGQRIVGGPGVNVPQPESLRGKFSPEKRNFLFRIGPAEEDEGQKPIFSEGG